MDEKNTPVVESEQPAPLESTTPEAAPSGGAAGVSEPIARRATEQIDPETFGIDPALLASLDDEEPDPQAATPTETQQAAETPPEPAPQVEAPAATPEPVAAAPTSEPELPAIPTGQGYPSIEPAPGTDAWGNLLYNGKAYVSVPDPSGGAPQLFEADPQTGLIALTEAELGEMRANNPEDYIAYTQEAAARRTRLGEVLTASVAREETMVKQAITKSGISAETFSLLDTEARAIMKPMGAQAKAPGVYSQAVELAIGKAFTQGGKVADEIVKAYLAMQQGQPAAVAQPAPVAQPAAAQPQRTTNVRLAAGVAHTAAPPTAAPQNTASPSVDPELATLLAKSGLSLEDYQTYGGSLVVN